MIPYFRQFFNPNKASRNAFNGKKLKRGKIIFNPYTDKFKPNISYQRKLHGEIGSKKVIN
jgi:hypothetical protein